VDARYQALENLFFVCQASTIVPPAGCWSAPGNVMIGAPLALDREFGILQQADQLWAGDR
jgi:hypothetical protein